VNFHESNPLHLLVRQLDAYIPLSAADEAAIGALPYKVRALEAQSYTLREGDRPDRCAVLISGYAYRHKVTGDGSRQILSLHIPGDALDFQNMFLTESDHNVQMLTRGDVAEIAREPLEHLVLANPRVGEAIFIAALVEASIFANGLSTSDAATLAAELPTCCANSPTGFSRADLDPKSITSCR
jgi:CRP-like cAMP-binding protein